MKKLYPIQDVAKYIALSSLTKNITVSPLKLQKLLYYAQAWSMVFGGRDNHLFADVPEAWVNGPVYPDIYDMWRNYGMCDHLSYDNFGTTKAKAMSAFKSLSESMELSENEKNLLEQIVVLYGTKTQNELIYLTHTEKPWCEKRVGLEPFERSTRKISLDTMHQYYKERHQRNLAARSH